jgi:SAM-dependent methyltransferase
VPTSAQAQAVDYGVTPTSNGRQSYGSYILRTGSGAVRDLELLYGAHWFSTRFAGKRPILDLGPGRCWFTKQKPEDIIAVDNAPELVDHYRSQRIAIRLGNAYSIPFPQNSFQGVFCCWLLEHLAEPDRAMLQIHRVLQPGGYACVIVPSPNDLMSFYDDYTHIRPFTHTSLRQLAEDAGFAKSKVEYLPWTRGLSYVLRIFGSSFARKYLRLSDSILRKFCIVNRNNLMLEAWK